MSWLSLKILVLTVFLFTSLPLQIFAAESPPMKLITLFTRIPRNVDMSLPNIHPVAEENRMGYRFVSVEEGDIVRVAAYAPGFFQITGRIDYLNTSGKSVSGLPAGYLKNPPLDNEDGIRFGKDLILKPHVYNAKRIGSSEWPSNMTWRHVHGNYYIITVYREHYIVFEELVTSRKGFDLQPFLGESHLKPGTKPFGASWEGASIFIDTRAKHKDEVMSMYLDAVREKDLPADFPKNLVRWIP